MRLFKNQRNVYVFECSFAQKDIPKKARFFFNSEDAPRQWSTKSQKVASRVAEFAEEPLRSELLNFRNNFETELAASKATNADVEIPCPANQAYLPFQKAGIAYAMNHQNTLFGDEMGLGKTIQAVGTINTDSSLNKILVICPASLKINWFKEMNKWLIREYRYEIVSAKSGWNDHGFDRPTIMIINFDILCKYHDEVHRTEWDLLIVDEAHKLKNPKAKRTKEVVGSYEKQEGSQYKVLVGRLRSRRNLFLTGTPLLNRPAELWPIANYLAPDVFRSKYWYYKTYCAAAYNGYGMDVKGASNLESLQEKLRTTFMIRRLKKDVLTELPAKMRQVIEIPANGHAGLIEEEWREWNAREEERAALRMAVELAKASEDKNDYDEAVRALKRSYQVAFSEMAKVRHNVALAKVPLVIDYLKDATESHKVVVFTHHHDVTDAIAAEFGAACVVLDGRVTKMEERDARVSKFQDDPNVVLFIGSIQAAGVGITLTAASHVVFAELDWVPANMTQAEDRCHRIGQLNSVLVQHLVLEGSLDAYMASKIVEKQNVIDRALDGNTLGIQKIEASGTDEAATQGFGRDRIGQIANRLLVEDINLIHSSLKWIAGLCDGARQLDNVGFNKVDSYMGKSLAQRTNLSNRQAALGLIIVIKYRRQLGTEVSDRLRSLLVVPAEESVA